MIPGTFITLEGIDGAGKTTHINWLQAYLVGRGHQVLVTREPGGTALGEVLRDLVLNHNMHPETEALLMFAARREHIELIIKPALNEGKWVISDRFSDASYAYQGGGRGLGIDKIAALESWVHPELQPDLTFLFDVPIAIARQRLSNSAALDRFEEEQQAFFERVRAAYLARASSYPARIHVIDSTQTPEQIRSQLEKVLLAS